MNVAIMGAGLSGLSCAMILEKHGIRPTIFEKRGAVGDRFANGEIMLSFLSRPVTDEIAYFSDQYGVYLQPTSHIHHLILHSERRKAVVSGHLGFCNLRGNDPKSFEYQLARQVQSEIVFDARETYEQLSNDYTHVIMATGDAAYALKMQNYRLDFAAKLNGCRVSGNFDRYAVHAWLNNKFAPYGYGYLIPISEKEADLVLWYPEYCDSNQRQDPAFLLDQFYHQASRDLDQKITLISRFEVHGYQVGICRAPRIGNTYFTGNCFGAITPYLGFGQFVAISTGIYAALDLCRLGKYEELTKPLRKNYENSLVLRRAWEQYDNRQFDWMTRFFGSWLGNKILTAQRLDAVKIASFIARPGIKPR